jgi:hypothetical protein
MCVWAGLPRSSSSALTRFLEHVCRLPEVRCVPYVEVADWLDDHGVPAAAS